ERQRQVVVQVAEVRHLEAERRWISRALRPEDGKLRLFRPARRREPPQSRLQVVKALARIVEGADRTEQDQLSIERQVEQATRRLAVVRAVDGHIYAIGDDLNTRVAAQRAFPRAVRQPAARRDERQASARPVAAFALPRPPAQVMLAAGGKLRARTAALLIARAVPRVVAAPGEGPHIVQRPDGGHAEAGEV